MADFPPAQPHAMPEELFPDVFLVRGSVQVAPLVRITRNMVVLRHGRDLTLVNAVRMTPEGEAALEALGTVRHLVKLGHFHGMDDPYTRQRWSPTFWSVTPTEPGVERLTDGGAGPLPTADVFVFGGASIGEAALVWKQAAGGLVITCDSVQHWPDVAGCSFVGGLVGRQMGFLRRPLAIGPIWAKQASGGAPAKLRPDFERLLSADFRHLVAAHGRLLRDDAHRALTESVDATLR